jgi:Na+-driven multidrug efflux pump
MTLTDDEDSSPSDTNSLTKELLVVSDTFANGTGPTSKRTTGQSILDLAIPALGALLIDPLMTLVDTAFVGHYSVSAAALAGMGSASALLTFCFYLFNFLTTATTPLVASRRAAGEETAATAMGGQALSLALGLGAILTTGIIVFKQPLLDIMGTSITGPEANEYATGFLMVRALAAPAVLCVSASNGILRGYLDTRTPIVILVVANAINFILDVVLIVQAKLGPVGAAWATTSAEWITALLFLGVLAGKLPSANGLLGSNQQARSSEKHDAALNGINGEERLSFLAITPSASIPPWQEIQPLIVASSSVLLRSLVLQISLSAAAAFAARGAGEEGVNIVEASANVAAHQVAIQLWLFCSFMADALAAASQGLVADALGRQDGEGAREISKVVLAYSVGLGLLLTLMLQLGASSNILLDFFTQDTATQKALSHILILIIAAQPLNSLVFASDGILQGAEEFTFQAKSMALSGAVAAGSFLLLQNFGQSSDTLFHVWSALVVLMFMRGLTSLVKMVDKNGPIDLLNIRGR